MNVRSVHSRGEKKLQVLFFPKNPEIFLGRGTIIETMFYWGGLTLPSLKGVCVCAVSDNVVQAEMVVALFC